MKFTNAHKSYFNADEGAFSIITEREYYDSQLTFTDIENEIALSFFGVENIHRGKVSDNRELSSKAFRLFGSGEIIFLNVNFPKSEKPELRLYLSKRAGFKPEAGHIWFLYKRESELWIGSLSQEEWGDLKILDGSGRQDEYDFIFQESIITENSTEVIKLKERDVFKRNRILARESIARADYWCEVDPKHQLFISRHSGNRYVEAHHLIPLATNDLFDKSLDIVDNIFCLCPNCHRAVHHAESNYAKHLLDRLVEKRNVLEEFSLDLNDLYYLYSI